VVISPRQSLSDPQEIKRKERRPPSASILGCQELGNGERGLGVHAAQDLERGRDALGRQRGVSGEHHAHLAIAAMAEGRAVCTAVAGTSGKRERGASPILMAIDDEIRVLGREKGG